MNFAYRTVDDVNAHTAARLADQSGVGLYRVGPREPMPAQAGGLVLDLDFLPAELVEELLANVPEQPVAVHGYNLAEEAAQKLRRLGVAVFRYLDRRVFEFLRAAALGR